MIRNAVACVVALHLLCISSAFAQQNPSDTADWWIAHYGIVLAKDDPVVAHSEEIFNRVRSAADKRQSRYPKMVVIRTLQAPHAEALHDGTVIVTRAAIDTCYRSVTKTVGDTRMAFVLAHEVAHLAKDDFWHQAAFAALQKHAADPQESKDLEQLFRQTTDAAGSSSEEVRMKEVQADGYAVLYMTVAGFDPSQVVTASGKDAFFGWLGNVAGASERSDHPDARARLEFVRSQILAMVEDVDLYRLAVTFLILERYEDSISLLKQFAEKYPGKEVLNNLGLCYYFQAFASLTACDARLVTRFRLPVMIDPSDAPSVSLTLRGSEPSPCYDDNSFREQSDLAIRYLTRSAETDSEYLPARLNLASAFILSSSYSKALAAADEAIAIDSKSPQAHNAKAIALYLLGATDNIETYAQSLQLLSGLEELPDVIFNRAVMQSEQGYASAARESWQQYLRMESSGVYADIARQRLGFKKEVAVKSISFAAPRSPIPMGKVSNATSAVLAKMRSKEFTLRGIKSRLYTNDRTGVLVVEDRVELVKVLLPDSTASVNSVLEKYGAPVRSVRWPDRELLLYPHFAVDARQGNPLWIIIHTG